MTGFDRAQAAYDNATPEDRWVFDGEDEEEDPDDARDRAFDAELSGEPSEWDDAPSGLVDGDWGGPNPLD